MKKLRRINLSTACFHELCFCSAACSIMRGKRNVVLLPVSRASFIDECYSLALEHGALAGKITGASGGGFLLLYCPEEQQQAMTEAVEQRGLKRMNFRFDHQGATVLLNVANFSNLRVAPYTNHQSQEPLLQVR